MDDRSRRMGFAANLSPLNGFKTWGSKSGNYGDTMLRLNSSSSSSCLYDLNSKGTKRKWSDIGGTEMQRHAPLALHIGHSSSSSGSSKRSSPILYSMSSTKETDEEYSVDLGLNFELHLGNDGPSSSKNPVISAPKALNTEPDLNLQLSLSVGQSVVTNTTVVGVQHPNNLENPIVFGQLAPVDDGTVSSRWKNGGLILPYLGTSEAPAATPPLSAHPVQLSDLPPNMILRPKSPVTCTSVVGIQRQQRNATTKNCEYPGCVKGARGASGRCIAHGGGRRCQKAGCLRGAEGKTIYCKAHGGGRRCEHLGCTKSAEGRTDYCIAHGGGRRCRQEGCTRAARGKSGLCIRHGGGKRCQKENCTKSAEGYTGLCISHGGGRRCQFVACMKGAQGSTMFCKAHGGGKRCTFPECKKGAEGSTPFCKGHGGGKRCSFQGGCPKSVHGGTLFCVAHGGGKRCAAPDCTKSARGRTDFCVRHGGGKRCKSEGCGKSAQGSTDFCKAHGGGKRCSWGQPGSGLGAGRPACDRFARGKIGLCASHSALLQDHRVHGAATLGSVAMKDMACGKLEKMKEVAGGDAPLGREYHMGWSSPDQKNLLHYSMFSHQPGLTLLPEGRVHGGNLMAFLSGSPGLGGDSGKQAECGTSQQDVPSGNVTHRWV